MIKRIIDKIRYHLVLQVFRNQLAKIGIKFMPFYVYRISLTNITEPPKIRDEDTAGYELEILGTDDINYIGNNARGYAESRFLKNSERGNICIGVKHNHKIAAFAWFDLDECNFEPHRFKLKKTEAYCFSLFTMESFRGKNIATYLLYHSFNILKYKNINTIYSVNEFFNSSSLRIKKKLNGTKMKLILYVELFKKLSFKVVLRNYHGGVNR